MTLAPTSRTPPAQLPGDDPAPLLAQARAAEVRRAGQVLLPAVDLEVQRGETVAIVGRSGAGKSTLLLLLAGLIAPTSGRVDRSPAALLPQRDALLPWATAQDNAALALRATGMRRREAREAATAQLAALGIDHLARRRAARLSGGERGRVALARTLLTGRPLLLLDEPLAAVDALTREALHEVLLAHLGGERATVLVTHDVEEAARLGDRLLVLTPSGLRAPRVPLSGVRGERLSARGGEALRAAVHAELGA